MNRGHTEGSSLFIKGLVGYRFGITIFLSNGILNVSQILCGELEKTITNLV